MPKPIEAEIVALTRSLRRMREDFDERVSDFERDLAELKAKAEAVPPPPKPKDDDDD